MFQPWKADLSLLIQPSVLLNLLFLGVVASLICFAVWNVVLKNLGTVRASNYIYLNPLFTLVGSAILLDEHLTVIALIGAACIMGEYIWQERNNRQIILQQIVLFFFDTFLRVLQAVKCFCSSISLRNSSSVGIYNIYLEAKS